MKCIECVRQTLNPKFCSRRCSVRYNNRRRVQDRFCENCRKSLRGKSIRQSCCSYKCQREKEWKQRKKEIEADSSSASAKALRKYLLDTRECVCVVCKRKTWQGRSIPLEVDHLDGDYRNNNLVNVRLICPNCHAQTPTYKNKNRGSGRTSRRH